MLSFNFFQFCNFLAFTFDVFKIIWQNFSLIQTLSNCEILDLEMAKDKNVNIAVTQNNTIIRVTLDYSLFRFIGKQGRYIEGGGASITSLMLQFITDGKLDRFIDVNIFYNNRWQHSWQIDRLVIVGSRVRFQPPLAPREDKLKGLTWQCDDAVPILSRQSVTFIFQFPGANVIKLFLSVIYILS